MESLLDVTSEYKYIVNIDSDEQTSVVVLPLQSFLLLELLFEVDVRSGHTKHVTWPSTGW